MYYRGKKASFKDEKFGFGGRKKRSKYNTAESYAEGYNNPIKKKKNGPGSKSGPKGASKGGPVKKFQNKNKPKKFANKKR